MHQNLIFLMTIAWPLEDQAYSHMLEAEREEWMEYYHRLKASGTYVPFAQTCWY